MIASIIGAEGCMGKWLTIHLKGLGHEVHGFNKYTSFEHSILADSDLVIVSVPVGLTAGVIKAAIKHMRKDATIMEIASLKTGIHETMREAAAKGFKTLCVHPMFGPSVTSLEEKTVAVIPVVDVESEKIQVISLFPGASIVVVEPSSHDRLMSLILSLPYLVNLALAGVMKDEDLNLLKRLSGTSFALQYTLIQSVAREKTSLVHALLSENSFLENSAERFIENLQNIIQVNGSIVEFKELHEDIKESLSKDPVYDESHKIRQAAYDTIRPLLR